MKTIKSLAMMMLLLVMTVVSSSCNKDDDEKDAGVPSSSIVGSWRQTNDYGTIITLTFRSDKTGVINYLYPEGVGDENENFEYDYLESERSLLIIGSQLNGTYTVSLTASMLILFNATSEFRFTKV